MKNCTSNGKSPNRLLCETVLAVVCAKGKTMKLSLLFLLLAIVPTTIYAQAIQHKACSTSPCTLDKPVTEGDLLVVATQFACISVSPGINTCDTVSDELGNTWAIAIVVPNSNGTPLYYAVNSKGGYDSISFHGWDAIIAEYPPSLGLDDANWGQYGLQTTNDEVGASNDIGWAKPVETSYPNDLLIAWSTAGTDQSNAYPVAGPFFKIVESSHASFALEDSIAKRPGLYMASLGWDSPSGGVYAHWTMGLAAFRMGTIAVENPSFEEIAPLLPSPGGPWSPGPIPGWKQYGNTGLSQPLPGTRAPLPVPDGKTVVWMDSGAISQDLGDTSAKPYTLSVFIGNRDGDGTWTISLNAGTTVLCTTSGNLRSIPLFTYATQTLSCNVPAGDLTIVLAIEGRGALDNVRLTTTEQAEPIKNRGRFKKREPRLAEARN
jgi:hypothetical protein